MAKYNTSRYQYETSPRKLQPEYIPTKKKYPKKSTVRKSNIKNQNKKEETININSKIILYIGIVFIILFAISYRNALIAQEYSEIKSLKSQLAVLEKDNKQLEVNIESKTNLSSVEKKGKEELGLKKLDDSQTVYICLDKEDYVESSTEKIELEEDKNWFENIIDKLKNIF